MFEFNGHSYAYFDHPYNSTRLNERAVEVPVGLAHLRGHEADTLEVGAVLPHYVAWETLGYPRHTVIDLYEAYPGVTNDDVLAYRPRRFFERIISISTLEHLGGAGEFYQAVRRLRHWLACDGTLFITVPGGWSGAPYLTAEFLMALGLTVHRLDKVDPVTHDWHDMPACDPSVRAYDGATRWANTVYLAEYRK